MRKEYDLAALKRRKNPHARRLRKQVTIRLGVDVIEYFKGLAQETGIPYQNLINLYLRECVAGPVTKMLVSKSPETLRQIESALEEQLPTQVSVTKTDDYLLQIAVAGVSKSAALEDILRRRGLTRDDLVAIGDAPNDVDMLQFAALGIAVDNAPSEVKAAAQVVAPSNDEDGVAVAIEEHVL